MISPTHVFARCAVMLGLTMPCLHAGSFSAGLDDPGNTYDAPVPGFVGPDGEGLARLPDGEGGFSNANNFTNPIFFGWASQVTTYTPAPGVSSIYSVSANVLGEVTGDLYHVASLGDLTQTQITNGVQPGRITVQFAQPIRNFTGADFVIYENGFVSDTGGVWAELAYVEVSSDGLNFTRFPATSLTSSAVGNYGTVDPTGIRNLAGKHVNAGGDSWGTPFDLGEIGMDSITHVRLVDIPGNGSFPDSAGRPIYDSWVTFGSGGMDPEALGAISRTMTFSSWPQLQKAPAGQRGDLDDPDHDGLPNVLEYAFARLPWSHDTAVPVVKSSLVSDGEDSCLALTFTRDERLTDLTYEVRVSEDLTNWTAIARSQAGQAFAGVGEFAPVITEQSASAIASIGVLREVSVRDVASLSSKSRRFMRVEVIRSVP